MALSLPISTPSAGNSPSSDDSSNHPLTPDSPGVHSLPVPSQSTDSTPNVGQMKRKPSRRANTAERRATHNAVERQRRETLNGRFLDLAALLPNLSQIRRPSKSSIVNSSIAHINASRRHRLLASRELRQLKQETDSLRRELNEWRSRAGVPMVEEPVRGEGFTMVLSGEIEVLANIVEDDEEGAQDYDGYDEGNDEFAGAVAAQNNNIGIEDSDEQQQRNHMAAAAAVMIKNANANNPFAQTVPSMGHLLARGGPMIASGSPTNVSFENPAMASLYEPTTSPHHHSSQQQFPFLHQMSQEAAMDKWSQPSPQQMYSLQSQQQQQQQQQRNMFNTRQSSAITPPPSSAPAAMPDSLFFANLQRQQQLSAMEHMYGSPIEGDDASSIGSVHSIRGTRQRSGSLSNGSNGYLTPPQTGSPTGSFDIATVMGDVVAGRRASSGNVGGGSGGMTGGLRINTGWRNSADMDGMVGVAGLNMMKQQQPISVGGGGSGGFMSMMF